MPVIDFASNLVVVLVIYHRAIVDNRSDHNFASKPAGEIDIDPGAVLKKSGKKFAIESARKACGKTRCRVTVEILIGTD